LAEPAPAQPWRVRRATPDDLDALAPLFDGYRQFYGQPGDPALARSFLAERLERGESAVFVAEDGAGVLLGFTQLFPSFSSMRARRIYILNDLFVAPAARGSGVGRTLLEAARAFGVAQGAARLTLSTAHDNLAAQALYEGAGWQRDSVFRVYNLALEDN